MAKFDPDAYLGGTVTQEADKKKRGGFDPDAYLAAPATAPQRPQETAGQTFGRSAASLADTALNAITGTLDVAAYPFARAYYGTVGGLSPEAAAARATAETTSPKDVVGRAFGVTGTTGYEQAPLRSAGRAIGETLSENVIQPVAQTFNIPESDVGNMLNSLAIGAAPVAGRATAATGRAVKSAAQVPVDVVRGAAGRATGYIAKPGETPTGYQVPSSRIPLGETFIPAKEMAELQRGMPISEGSVRPISELAPGPVLALSGGEIPVAGQAARAFGERLGETYSNPYTAAADIGSMFLTGGIPVLTAGRGALGLAQAGADAYLARKGFTGLTPEQTAALNQGANPFYTAPITTAPSTMGPVAPSTSFPLVVQGAGQQLPPTVMPMGGPGRRVNIEGETFNLPYQINVSDAQTARPQSTIGPTAEQLAAQQAAERARISEANKLRVAQQLEEQRNAAQPVQAEVTAPIAPTPEITAPVVEVPTAPKQQRPMTAAEIRRKLPRREGETSDQFESRVQDVLKARPMVDVEAPPAPKETGKRSYTRQEDRIREAEAKLTAEERAAQEAQVERQLAKSRGKTVSGPVAPTETVSTESLKAKMSTPEQTAMDEATRARLEQLGLLGKKKTPPKDTMEMISASGKKLQEFNSKQDFLEQQMIDKLSGKITSGTYMDNGLRYEISEIDYGGVPRKILEDLNKPLTEVRVFSEKTNKQVSGPPPEIPEKSLRQRVEEQRKKRK